MAKFVFSMEGILKLKDRLEDLKKQEFGKAMAKLEQEKQVLNNLISRKESSVAEFKENVSGTLNREVSIMFNNYLKALKIKIEKQALNVKKAEREVEIKRAELLEATKEKKKLEKLKEKSYERFIEEEKQSEQKSVDELVSYKYSS